VLARRLQEVGHQAAHVLEISLAQCPDNDLWRYAEGEGVSSCSLTFRDFPGAAIPADIGAR